MKLGSSVAGAILFQGIQGMNHELYKKGSDNAQHGGRDKNNLQLITSGVLQASQTHCCKLPSSV
jgi:hypothetical protein